MAKLTQLGLHEFSIVAGDQHEPANPAAVKYVYKAKENGMSSKQTAPRAEGLISDIRAAIAKFTGVEQATQTRTTTYENASTSRSTEVLEMPDPEPVQQQVQQPVQQAAATSAAGDRDLWTDQHTSLVQRAIGPVLDAVNALGQRVETVERASRGSQALQRAEVLPSRGTGKFEEFTRFLAHQSGATSAGRKLTKATLTTSGWTYGLAITEAEAFIDYIVDQSVLLKKVRTIKMPDKKYNIDKIGLGGSVLVKGTAGTDPGDTVSLSGPTQVQLSAEEVLAIVSVGDDVLEDSIEGEAFVQHLLGMIARAAANELEQAAMHGDTAVADAGILDRWNGWNKLARADGAAVIEGAADADRYWPGTNGDKGTRVMKALPSKFRQDKRNLAWILAEDLYLDYQGELASKGYSEAYTAITGAVDVPLRGVQNVRMPLLKTNIAYTYSSTNFTDGTFVMLTPLQNLIMGIHRDIRIEPFRQPRKRATDYVLSMRGAVAVETGAAVAIYDHAKVR